jgi:argininosuccinate lyase
LAGARIVNSLKWDQRLLKADVVGSIAHVMMLAHTGIITRREEEALVEGLRRINHGLNDGRLVLDPSLEDVHTNVEALLEAEVGAVARKLHTARSRNDQVALDEKLHLRSANLEVLEAIHRLAGLLLARAQEGTAIPLPAYTHLQRAQPILLAHYLMAHFWALDRSFQRYARSAEGLQACPLGAGAVAGTSLPIDPVYTAHLLGFPRAFENSLDVVGDRDHMVEAAFNAALLAVHLSRIAEDLILWHTSEFAFVELPAAVLGGSSLLVHKRNPDGLEMVRAKAATAIAGLTGLLALLKGLPMGYNRDLQEDKALLFPLMDGVLEALETATAALEGARFNTETMAAAAGGVVLATDHLEAMVKEGKAFRDAWTTAAGAAVEGAPKGDHQEAVMASIGARASPGGSSPGSLDLQFQQAQEALGRQAYRIGALAKQVKRAEALLLGRKEVKV